MGADKVLCLITGPSGAGKTCIALELQKRLLKATRTTTLTRGSRKTVTEGDNRSGNPQSLPTNQDTKNISSVAVIHQDHYFTKPFLPYKERVDDSFEIGAGIDWDGLFSDVRSHLMEAPINNENGFNYGDRDDNGDSYVSIVIIEGHLLGDAVHLFRKNFSDCENVGILGVLLVGCSQESVPWMPCDKNFLGWQQRRRRYGQIQPYAKSPIRDYAHKVPWNQTKPCPSS